MIFLGTLLAGFDLNAQGLAPDHSKASIEGELALMEIALGENDGGSQPLDPSKCFVMLAPADALDQRIKYRCSEWYVPPARGAYVLWLEREELVSSSQILLHYVPTKYSGHGFVGTHDMVATGYVASATPIPAGHTLRYQHLDRPGRGFNARVVAEDAQTVLRMPPGRVVVGLYGPGDNAVAIAKPFEIIAGKTTNVQLSTPAEGSDLLVIVEKPRQERVEGRLLALVGGEERAADVFHETPGRYYAWWFGLDAKSATVRLQSDSYSLSGAEVALQSGRVATFRGSLAWRSAGTKGLDGPTAMAQRVD